MTNLYVVALLLFLTYVSVHVWFYADRTIRSRADAIATGVVQGIPITAEHRKFEIFSSWLRAVCGAIAYQTVTSIGWMVMAQHVSDDGVRVFAHLITALAWLGVLVWVEQGIMGYLYLASLVRRAEAD